jgi:hypothetical protein
MRDGRFWNLNFQYDMSPAAPWISVRRVAGIDIFDAEEYACISPDEINTILTFHPKLPEGKFFDFEYGFLLRQVDGTGVAMVYNGESAGHDCVKDLGVWQYLSQ